jgi:hypothetical protein
VSLPFTATYRSVGLAEDFDAVASGTPQIPISTKITTPVVNR